MPSFFIFLNGSGHLQTPTNFRGTRYRRTIPPRHRRQHDGDFDDLGHMPQEEGPVRTIDAVKQFLGLD